MALSVPLSAFEEYLNKYKNYVSQNPQVTSDVESSVKWISYFFAARMDDSSVWSELIYALSNLLVLYNDRIIRKSHSISYPSGSAEKLKVWLTVIEYSEVFIELSCFKIFGKRGKWTIIILMQIIKCLSRLNLLLRHRKGLVESPLIQPMNRTSIVADNSFEEMRNEGVVLKSGVVVKSYNIVPGERPTTHKSTRPVVNSGINGEPNGVVFDRTALSGEIIYILKPLIHLSTLMYAGSQKSWKPYLVSLGIDILSIHLINTANKAKLLSKSQNVELSRRTVSLLLYLLRSPFYNKFTKVRLNKLLLDVSDTVPLTGLLLRPLAEYIPKWQETYFYMWSI